ncbi:hypothetical protein [Duganella sp. S19_KUP01_CR8]|uniref:hypothetical protein n=1 Tax=Duganella sp. S19_KUP01_CR8 TaxID=3025502 RepID=UPI002FCDA091
MLIGQHYFFLELDKTEEALEEDDPSHYLYMSTGSLISLAGNDRRYVAGRFELFYVDIGAAINAGASIFDIFDSKQSAHDYHAAIFEPGTAAFSETLTALLDDAPLWGNILILDRLEILPKFRQKGLGLVVMRRLIERFGAGAAVVAIKPFPLQCEADEEDADRWRNRLKLSEFDKKTDHATEALRRYYKRLDFKAMEGTPFMFRSAEAQLPPPSDLVGDKTNLPPKA